jgi:hypothetical protein
MKWCVGWWQARTRSGSTRAAIGSILLRSPGRDGSVTLACKGSCRFWCCSGAAGSAAQAANGSHRSVVGGAHTWRLQKRTA